MIKKLFLVALLALVAYCYWPRDPDLLGYQPAEMAALQVQAARQAGLKQWFAHWVTFIKIYSGQYGFPPIAAMGTAMDRSQAIFVFRRATDDIDSDEIVNPLAEAYDSIKIQTDRKYDPKAMAEMELAIWRLIKDGAKDEVVIAKISEQLALIYGGTPKQYLVTAQFFAVALREAQASNWSPAQQNLQKAWANLKTAARRK